MQISMAASSDPSDNYDCYTALIILNFILFFSFITLHPVYAQTTGAVNTDRASDQPASPPAIALVKNFDFTCNTIFSDEELSNIAEPYKNKHLTFDDLDELRQKLTDFYTQKGYINSGALIPDQKILQGIVIFQIVEGEISDIEVSTDGRLRSSYIRKRLAFDPGIPLNINALY